MTPELERALSEKYPVLFKDFSGGIGVGDGWYNILESLFSAIEYYLQPGESFTILQIKEKFGSLRFYARYDSEYSKEIGAIIDFAEHQTSKICEVCGSPGTQTTTGWVKTLCETHKIERNTK